MGLLTCIVHSFLMDYGYFFWYVGPKLEKKKQVSAYVWFLVKKLKKYIWTKVTIEFYGQMYC